MSSSSIHGQYIGGQGHDVPAWGHYYDFDMTWPMHVKNALNHLPMLLELRRLRPQSILEVGSGTGSLAVCSSYFCRGVVSLDLSEQVLERAARNNHRFHGRARFVAGDAFTLSEHRDQSFDVAVSQGFFEHFDDDAIVALMEQQLRVARYMVLSVPNAAYGKQDRGDERLLTSAAWQAIIARGGFRVVRSSEYHLLNRRTLTPRGRRAPRTMFLATVTR